MYKEWFKKNVEIGECFKLDSNQNVSNSQVTTFFSKLLFRNIELNENQHIACRGHKLWNLFNAGDPRRKFHSLQITITPENVTCSFKVDSWFGIGTIYDIGVFKAELQILKNLLLSGTFDDTPLKEAQKLRRIADFKSFLILVSIGIGFGLLRFIF